MFLGEQIDHGSVSISADQWEQNTFLECMMSDHGPKQFEQFLEVSPIGWDTWVNGRLGLLGTHLRLERVNEHDRPKMFLVQKVGDLA